MRKSCRPAAVLLAAALLLSALLTGCVKPNPAENYQNPIFFYYCRKDAEYASRTGALASEVRDLRDPDISIADILKLYFAGPKSEDMTSPFPENLRCEDVSLQDGIVQLHLSNEYSALTGVRLSLASACITMTLSQIDFVKGVQIRTDAGTLSEQGTEDFSVEDFLLQDDSSVNPEQTVTLYFADKGSGKLKAEKRTITYTRQEDLPELALKALFAGPSEPGLSQAIPEGTELVDVSVSGSLCTVVVSETFADCDTDKTAAELAVHSIVATLCLLGEIDQVQISILNGADLKFCTIQKPLSTQDSWIG
jgi:spore germination protein GerM